MSMMVAANSTAAGAGRGVSIAVAYNNRIVEEGETMSPAETVLPPRIYIDDTRPGRGRSNGGGGGAGTYSVVMIDRNASRPGDAAGGILTYVHLWAVFSAADGRTPATLTHLLAPYVRPSPHDVLVHRYEFLVFRDSPDTTSPPFQYLYNAAARYTRSLLDLIPAFETPLASTSFIEQL